MITVYWPAEDNTYQLVTPGPAYKSPTTRFQPMLPPEEPPTKAERYFISRQPNIFPSNQDSNWGTLRKAWTDQVQDLIDQQSLIWKERFVLRADTFLDDWEFEAGIPEHPSGLTIDQRRAKILNRIRTGPFTEERLIYIIEPYIGSTFGTSVELGPGGVSLSGGIPLYADASGDPKQYYRIYHDIQNFAYQVWIASGLTPDIAGMTRDLARITPAGIALTVDNSHANIIDYAKVILNSQPVGYWRMGSLADSGLYGHALTDPGGTQTPATMASPGLLASQVAASNGAYDFDGVNDFLSYSSFPDVFTYDLTVEAVIRVDALPSGSSGIVWSSSGGATYMGLDTSGNYVFSVFAGGTQQILNTTIKPTVGSKYTMALRFDGSHMEGLVDGAVIASAVKTGALLASDLAAGYVGRWSGGGNFFNGVIDELAVFNQKISDSVLLTHKKARDNVLL